MKTKESFDVVVGHLKDHPEHLERIATWIYQEWWTDKPGVTVDSMKARLLEAKTDDSVPLSLIAFVNGEPAGTANLIESDNDEFPELKPWLAAMLVAPEFRGQGVASALIKEFIKKAGQLGIETFYLGTDIPDFYRKFGAENYLVSSTKLNIMQIDL